ncbi:MAG: hypothetical protein QF511_12350 [Rhodospirillales bacterium]|nr:hypothetical protein [Rhodospirillales bacterium]HIJ44497.1 hypothetical protein [Rhodospirillaceae bacterium]MDP7216367.1 hypothetical protein [Rhodospirillales bacterium]HIJ44738.1 hypothetical protein [Rhodospirillaceae bacterium]HIJ93428.1 hypothetical protein [Rhodospirillaceae bacterium]
MVRTTVYPLVETERKLPFDPANVFRWRVPRYLEWLGLMETVEAAANDQTGAPLLYRKTPLYDRFLSFDIDAA